MSEDFSVESGALNEDSRPPGCESFGTQRAMSSADEFLDGTGLTHLAGKTYDRFTGRIVPISSVGDSPASQSPKPQQEQSAENGGRGPSSAMQLRISHRNGWSSRTRKLSVTPIAASPRFYGTFTSWGSMRNGALYEHPTSVPHTKEPAYGWLPTPTHTANQLAPSMQKHPSCRNLSRLFPNGELCLIYEWMMGFPIGYSDASDSETPSSQQWRNGSDAA